MGFVHKFVLLCGMLLMGLGQAQAAATEKEDSQAAIALLEKALAYYHQNGDKAFAAFSRQGEFVDKDRYVFVVDTKGVMLASGGPSAALIGRDVSETLPPDLQKTFKDALKVPEGNGIQQGEYRWQNWSDGKVERKRVYYQRIGQRILAVGYYLPRASAEQAMALLNKAAIDLTKDEKGTLTAINSLKGGYLQDDLYVFVVDLNTRRYVAHGTNLRLINTDFSSIKDPEGNPVGEPILALMAKQDYGEYEYRWKNPVTTKVENKHAYLKKVGHFLVAVGYYSP
ncbi:calcium channel protein [Pseudomonas sp. Leaf48]|jgi:signal transduction histidine kinase|uniref:cache domain-containing protein n=1 Tax=unclassified Pseudomonas TaxID=196821 RepID=UPI00072480A7|nr:MULTISPECIES: cache domain-containing protein [unclassified Pseudomonas]KQN56063.1 calcium channel protein [Pseudomonas sp. Leaf48]MBV7478659.1 cache domain-containing protein [Pseudomonas sp. PDM31]